MVEPAPLSAQELLRREPVWQALSEFWLDTELQGTDYARIAEVLRASGYSIAELATICGAEVAPAVSRNLLSPAGEWAGFDPTWLRSEILRRMHSPSIITRVCRGLGLGTPAPMFGVGRHWRSVQALLRPPISGPA